MEMREMREMERAMLFQDRLAVEKMEREYEKLKKVQNALIKKVQNGHSKIR